ncbi:hypothetical protein [Endozoicomonas sp.]|uniref:hypothetical protein n=1 Tax=Endozoicomonas sp. TaxID=1892382 RepID=UPI002887D5B5|nr:hypothetical protein [Endozoicomonas sp.]
MLRYRITANGNNLTIKVVTGIDDTDPDRARGLRVGLREKLMVASVGEVLAAAKNTENRNERQVFLRQIVKDCLLSNVGYRHFEPNAAAVEPPETEPDASGTEELGSHIPSYDDLPVYTPKATELDDSRFCCISYESDTQMVFQGKHFYGYKSLVAICETHGGIDPYDREKTINWDKVYKIVSKDQIESRDIVSKDQIESRDNKAFEPDEAKLPDTETTKS